MDKNIKEINCTDCQQLGISSFKRGNNHCVKTGQKILQEDVDSDVLVPMVDCPLSQEKKVMCKIRPTGMSWLICELDDIKTILGDDADIIEGEIQNPKWEIKLIMMSEYEYNHLKEFEGW